jgi:hypothetical protein
MSALIAGTIVVAGASAYSAYSKGQAAKKAANMRIAALDQVKELDIPGIQTAAQKADTERFKGSLELQRKEDPMAAEARAKGLAGVVESVSGSEDQSSKTALERALETQNLTAEQTTLLKQTLLENAKTALAQGASLPPEFQAELVRTGLEQTSTAGLTPDRQGASGQTLRKLVGSAGLQLQEQRRQQAIGTVAAVDQSNLSQASILSNLAQSFQALIGSRAQRATNAANVGQSLLPAFGLTGGDTSNLMVANTNLKNSVTLAKGDAIAQKALASGAMKAELAGVAASAVGGLGTGGMTGSGILGAGQANKWWGFDKDGNKYP